MRRFSGRLFRQRRRQSWEEEVEAGGSPRSGRRLEAVHRVPARINDLTGRRNRAPSRVAWVGGGPGARGPAGGPGGRCLPRRGEKKAEEREPRRRSRGACGGKGSSGPGRASAGRRLSQRRLRAPAAATGGFKLCGRRCPSEPQARALPLGGNFHAGLSSALAAGSLRFSFAAAAAALLAEGTRDT